MIEERKYIPSKQEEKVLHYLRNHDGMTTLDACSEMVLAPAKCVQILRNAGYNIETIWKKTETGKRYGVYVLHEKEAANNGEK